uniref:Ovule protein n=1 Tax=Caenorhabditis tropicalis TaxID=1561998 RepID=A0A1I7TK20_9PELO
MAHRMNISHFGRQYQEAGRRYYETPSVMQNGQNSFPPPFVNQQEQYGMNSMSEWNEPPSWADVKPANDGMVQVGKAPHQSFERQRPQPQQQMNQFPPQAYSWGQAPNQPTDESNDVFSTMGHWGPPPNANGQKHQYNQYGHHHQSPNQNQNEDVFDNIGEWNGNPEPPRPLMMSIDLNAPTPLPTVPSYPMMGTHSVESPTTSNNSTEERNSWKTIEAILSSVPSRSPSVAEEVDIYIPANSNRFWNSNLQNY